MKKVKALFLIVISVVALFALNLILQNPVYAQTINGSPAPLLSGASIATGSIPGTTSVTGATYGTGDHFVYQIVTKVTVTPNAGYVFPAAAIYYEMGSNIPGVDAVNKKFVDVYEVDAFGKIVKFQEFTAALLPPAPVLSVTVAPGSIPGTTKVNATPDSGNTLAYKLVKKVSKTPLTGAFLPAESLPYTSGSDISSVDLTTNKYVDVYVIGDSGKIVSFTEITLQTGNILAPTLLKKPVVVKSVTAKGTKLTLTPNKAGDTFQTMLTFPMPGGGPSINTPAIGDSLPVFNDPNVQPLPMGVISIPQLLNKTGEIGNVSPYINVNIFELDNSQKIVSFTVIELKVTEVSLPTLNISPTVTASTYAGATAITATLNFEGISNGGASIPSDKFVYKIVSKPTKAQPGYDITLPSDIDLSKNTLVSGTPTDVIGADPKTNKYIDIYEYSDWLNTIRVIAFKEIMLDTTSIRANAATVIAAPGKTAGTTKLTVTPAKTGNTFMTIIGTSPTAPPTIGIAAPTGVAAYTSGKDLKLVDAVTNKYVDVYEMSAGKIVGFKEIILTGADITAPALTAVAAAGSASGKTKATASAAIGNSLSIKIVSTPTALPVVGSALPSGTLNSYVSDSDITGADAATNKYIDVYEVDIASKVVSFKEIILTSTQIKK